MRSSSLFNYTYDEFSRLLEVAESQDAANYGDGVIVVGLSVAILLTHVLLQLSGWSFDPPTYQESLNEKITTRVYYLDFWRCLCIFAVVVAHSNEDFHEENAFGTCTWVLQFLMLISGTCFARSKKSLMGYCFRLMLFWSVGVLLNALALELTQRSWKHDALKVQFQMMFVHIIMAPAVLANPLKIQLQERSKTGGDAMRANSVALVLYSALAATTTIAYGSACHGGEFSISGLKIGQNILLGAMEMTWLLLLASLSVATDTEPTAGWFLIALIAASRILIAQPRPGSEFHEMDLFIWAVFVQLSPLKHGESVGVAIAQAWPIWGAACILLMFHVPAKPRSIEQYPSDHILERLRFYLVETLLAIAFTTIPYGGTGKTLVMPPWLRPHMNWLNYFSLAAFCGHKAVLNLVQ